MSPLFSSMWACLILANFPIIFLLTSKTYKNPGDSVFNSIPFKLEYYPLSNLGLSRDKGLEGSTI